MKNVITISLALLAFLFISVNCNKVHNIQVRVINNCGEHLENIRFNSTEYPPLNDQDTSEYKMVESTKDNLFVFSTTELSYESKKNLDLDKAWDYSVMVESGDEVNEKFIRVIRE